MTYPLHLLAAGLVFQLFGVAQADVKHRAAPALDTLLADLEVQEAAYGDVDVRVRFNYTDTRPLHPDDPDRSRVLESVERVRFVSSGGRTRVESDGEHRSEARTQRTHLLSIFNGIATQVTARDPLVNIYDGIYHSSKAIYPHNLLTSRVDVRCVPLSTYMKGAEAIAAFRPSDALSGDLSVSTRVVGREDREGLDCTKIRIDIVRPRGEMVARWDYWLAHDRNLIPVRVESYTGRISDTIPLGEGTVTSWTELTPGLWYPMSGQIVTYSSFDIKSSQEQILTLKYNFVVEAAEVSPTLPEGFFEHVKIADGSRVYRIDDRGEVHQGFVAGRAKNAPTPPAAAGNFRNWLLIANLAAASAVAVAVVLSKRRRRTKEDLPE